MTEQSKKDSQCLLKINGGTECKELCDGCFEVWKLNQIGEGRESGIALLNAVQPELWNEVGGIIKNAIGLDPYRVAKIIDYLKDQFTLVKTNDTSNENNFYYQSEKDNKARCQTECDYCKSYSTTQKPKTMEDVLQNLITKTFNAHGETMSNKIAEYAVKILREYVEETSVLPRSTSDLSPLEEWLIIRLCEANDIIEELKKVSEKYK